MRRNPFAPSIENFFVIFIDAILNFRPTITVIILEKKHVDSFSKHKC